jgi:hypothetical protein
MQVKTGADTYFNTALRFLTNSKSMYLLWGPKDADKLKFVTRNVLLVNTEVFINKNHFRQAYTLYCTLINVML